MTVSEILEHDFNALGAVRFDRALLSPTATTTEVPAAGRPQLEPALPAIRHLPPASRYRSTIAIVISVLSLAIALAGLIPPHFWKLPPKNLSELRFFHWRPQGQVRPFC